MKQTIIRDVAGNNETVWWCTHCLTDLCFNSFVISLIYNIFLLFLHNSKIYYADYNISRNQPYMIITTMEK